MNPRELFDALEFICEYEENPIGGSDGLEFVKSGDGEAYVKYRSLVEALPNEISLKELINYHKEVRDRIQFHSQLSATLQV